MVRVRSFRFSARESGIVGLAARTGRFARIELLARVGCELSCAALLGGAACTQGARPASSTELLGEGGSGGADLSGDDAPPCEADCISREVASWPLPHAASEPGMHPREYVDHGALVEDRVTGLVWTRAHFAETTYAEAVNTCSALTVEEHGDFRLPTRIELTSLLSREGVPTIDLAHFPDTPPDYFWSSTSVPGHEDLAYSVYFGLGETATGQKDQASALVRCVRGGRRAPIGHREVGPDFVTDAATRLVWQRGQADASLTLASATLYCAGRTGPTGARMRLPRAGELASLVDVTRQAPAIDPAFEATPSAGFWTAKPPAGTSSSAEPLVLDFELGLTTATSPDETRLARCVQDAEP